MSEHSRLPRRVVAREFLMQKNHLRRLCRWLYAFEKVGLGVLVSANE